MNRIQEIDFLEGIKKGDERIIKAFYQKNYRLLRNYVLLNSGKEEDVEDVFQDGLILIYQKLRAEELEISCSIHTYFFAVCKNVWRNKIRRMFKVVPQENLVATTEEEPKVFEDFEKLQRQQLFRKYFLTLSADCKKLLSLVFEGKSTKEMASTTGYSEGNVRKKKFDCKNYLMAKIEKDPLYTELKNPALKNPTPHENDPGHN